MRWKTAPTRWWSISSSARREFKPLTLTLSLGRGRGPCAVGTWEGEGLDHAPGLERGDLFRRQSQVRIDIFVGAAERGAGARDLARRP